MGELFPVLTRLYDFLVMFIPHFVIVNTTQEGVKWRWGSKVRVVKHDNGTWVFGRTGIHWYWPVVTDIPTVIPIKRQTKRLPKQNLTTKDGLVLHLRGFLIYEISDVEQLLTQCYDYDDTAEDFAIAAISQVISNLTYEELVGDSRKTATNLGKRLRAELKEFGIKVIRLSLSDFAKGETLNHLTDLENPTTISSAEDE